MHGDTGFYSVWASLEVAMRQRKQQNQDCVGRGDQSDTRKNGYSGNFSYRAVRYKSRFDMADSKLPENPGKTANNPTFQLCATDRVHEFLVRSLTAIY
jgi:hypothetical protein